MTRGEMSRRLVLGDATTRETGASPRPFMHYCATAHAPLSPTRGSTHRWAKLGARDHAPSHVRAAAGPHRRARVCYLGPSCRGPSSPTFLPWAPSLANCACVHVSAPALSSSCSVELTTDQVDCNTFSCHVPVELGILELPTSFHTMVNTQ